MRALVRHLGDRERLPDPRVELAVGHLDDEESLVRAADGCEVVYRVAGVNRFSWPTPPRCTGSTSRAPGACWRRPAGPGVRRVVHTSWAATLGGDGGAFMDETTGPPSEYLPLRPLQVRGRADRPRLRRGRGGGRQPQLGAGPGAGRRDRGAVHRLPERPLPRPAARFGICYTVDCVNGHLLAEPKGRPGHRYVLNTDTLTNSEAIDLIARHRRPGRAAPTCRCRWPWGWRASPDRRPGPSPPAQAVPRVGPRSRRPRLSTAPGRPAARPALHPAAPGHGGARPLVGAPGPGPAALVPARRRGPGRPRGAAGPRAVVEPPIGRERERSP